MTHVYGSHPLREDEPWMTNANAYERLLII